MLVLAAAVKYCVPEKRQRDRRKIPRVCSKLQGLQGLLLGGSVAEWLACWTQAQKAQSRRCRVTVLGKLFTPVVPLFTDQQNW